MQRMPRPPKGYKTWLDAAVGSFPNTNLSLPDAVGFEQARQAVDAELAVLREAMELLKNQAEIEQADKRLQREYPAGTCNAEDAWSEHGKRERNHYSRRTAFLAKHGGS